MSHTGQSYPAPPPRPAGTAETRPMPGLGPAGQHQPGQHQPGTDRSGGPGSDAAPARRGRATTVAVAVAAAALLVAVVSAGLSWRALDQASDARDIAVAAGTGAQGPDGQPVRPTASAPQETGPQDNGAASAEPFLPDDPAITPQEPELNEQTEFKVKYEKELLRLRAECNYQMKADLDEPRVGVDSHEDLVFNMACSGDTSSLVLADGAVGARVDSSTVTPADCADQIRTGALPPQGTTPARQGVVLCVKTSHAAASEQGITQKMVILEVRGVAQDGTVTVQATAWDIPR